MESNVLIVGGDSQIGLAIASELKSKNISYWKTTRREEDLGNKTLYLDLDKNVENWNPPEFISTVIFCATVKPKEKQNSGLNTLNNSSTILLAKKFQSQGSFVIFLSTNSVYDGSVAFTNSTVEVCPRNNYGFDKAVTEKELIGLGDNISILRISKVVTSNMPIFLSWIHSWGEGKPVFPFDDMVMAPISISFVVILVLTIMKNKIKGIVQASADRDITYSEAAFYLAEQLGIEKSLISPSSYINAGISFSPAHTTLDSVRLKNDLLIDPPSPFEAIDEFLTHIKN
ncbi:sugar nucleotide-binding protein [Leptospira limi]|uniref:dTDP-4-dehydrorhamnose reductase n=1 Tax=Leptospira limi TaxID=2950023 RepID=A0ABT3LZ37_9LEPT|nr:sugar nucleotide-binding protein [Leptospira limi]MCW7462991.1 sugar nucleotide-binding protein [Leptospira limi]